MHRLYPPVESRAKSLIAAPAKAMLRALVLAVLLSEADAQRGSPFRCRDRDPLCKEWAGRGECASNHGFMAESCPAACDYCENAGLFPTPSGFQLDFVCNDQLAINPGTYKGVPNELPHGCEFRCRDNMTSCAAAAQEGLCEKRDVAAVVRAQCPQSCGVCKALELPGGSYPKHACANAEGDAPSHKDACGGWAASGECYKNFGFMGANCELSCGLCALDGSSPKAYQAILSPPKPAGGAGVGGAGVGGKKKKKRKTTAASVSATGAAEPVPTAEKPKAAPAEKPKAASAEKPKAASAEKPKAAAAEKPKAAAKKKPKAAAAEKPKAASAEKPKAAEPKAKKKGWMSGLADAVGGAFKGKKDKKDKDEA